MEEIKAGSEIVHKASEFKKNIVHHSANVHSSVRMGYGNFIGPFCLVGPNVVIGNNNTFAAYSSVGLPAEHRDFFDRFGEVVIGNDNVIREFTTINSSTKGVTRMGDRCVMLRGSHLSHDSILEDDVTLSCNALVGGESHVMRGANMALGSICHQRSVIGSWSMIGMGGIVVKKSEIIPGGIFVGNPVEFLKNNDVGLKRYNISIENISLETERFRMLKSKI